MSGRYTEITFFLPSQFCHFMTMICHSYSDQFFAAVFMINGVFPYYILHVHVLLCHNKVLIF